MKVAHITVLPDIDHIRLRPGMYIGNTWSPDHLLQEILDNSLDELVNDYASKIKLAFPGIGHAIVTDNGRGIPIHTVELENGKIENSVIVACTILKSGAKFDNDAYKMSIGLHGIGLVAVNALSQSMRVSVKDPETKQIHDFQFVDSQLQSYTIIEYDVEWSTRVEFIIDPKYFTVGSFDQQKFADRLMLVQSNFPQAEIFIDENKLVPIPMDKFVRNLLDLPEEHLLFRVPLETPNLKIQAFVTYDPDGAVAPELKGDVNLRMCGGIYLTNFASQFANAVADEYSTQISKQEALSYFRCYVSLFIQNPDFDSQSKVNMSKNITHLLTPLKENFVTLAKSNLVKQIVQIIVDRKTNKKISKKVTKKKRVGLDNPLKDCLKIPGETLYIMEGESADGTLNPIRDKKTEAILPISGKILNVANSSVEKAIDSKKFKFILEALGVDLRKQNQTSFRYKNIKILCDADPDGMHIVVLLLIGFWFYAPELIKQQRVSVILPPLYGVMQKGKFIPIYHAEDLQKYTGLEVLRFKGIGEMSTPQLKTILKTNPVEYVVKPPSSKEESENIIRCVTDTELKRRLCEDQQNFNINRLFPLTVKKQSEDNYHV